MSKINKYLNLQLRSEFKKDAEDCIKIKNQLKDLEGTVWSSKWSILIDTIFEGFPSDNRRFKPSKIGYIFLKGIKDNPVPSIIKDLYHVCMWYQGRDVDACERVEAYAKSLENGVETNNEQPKCSNESKLCTCSLGYPCENANQFSKDWHKSDAII